MATVNDSPHVPIGSYTDNPAANARHSADIADMMADRSEGHAQRSQDSADDAKHQADLAEIYCHTGEIHADRAANAAEHARFIADHVQLMARRASRDTAAACSLVFASVIAGFLLAILAFLVAALICINAVGIAHDAHGQPAPNHAASPSDRVTVQPNLQQCWS